MSCEIFKLGLTAYIHFIGNKGNSKEAVKKYFRVEFMVI